MLAIQAAGPSRQAISLFNGSLIMKDFVGNILIATAAANTGIDKDTIEMILCKGVPQGVITFLQKHGRNARQVGSNGAYFFTQHGHGL